MTETEALDELRQRMIGQRSGDVDVIDIRYEYLINEEAEEYLLVELVLPIPPAHLVTWPIDDILALRRRAQAQLVDLRVAPPFFVSFDFPPDPDELDDEAEVDT